MTGNKFYVATDSQTIIEFPSEKIVYFGFEDFKLKIVEGDSCFICGASKKDKEFNDEHIIPNWILKRYELHSKLINITTERDVQYGRYVVPCCKECNSQLGDLIETPISKLLTKTYNELVDSLKADNGFLNLIYRWMSLLFFKTHLKDTYYRKVLDTRVDSGSLGDEYDWAGMHHIHCMCRVHYTDAVVNPNVYGSLLILPTINILVDKFDYADLMLGKTVMIILNEICIIAVLDDSAAITSMMNHVISKITGPLTPYQIKEFFVRMAHANMHLEPRPTFSSRINEQGKYEIDVDRPEECRVLEQQIITTGELLYKYAKDFIVPDLPNRDKILEEIREGKRGYILNEKGEFIQHKLPS